MSRSAHSPRGQPILPAAAALVAGTALCGIVNATGALAGAGLNGPSPTGQAIDVGVSLDAIPLVDAGTLPCDRARHGQPDSRAA